MIFISQSGKHHQLQQFQWKKPYFLKHDLLQNTIPSKITKSMKLAIIVEHLKISNHRSFLYLFSKIKLHLKNILAKIPKRSSLTWDFPKLLKRATMSRLTRMNDFCKKLQLYPKRSFYVLLSNQVPINYFFWYFKGAKTCWIECLLCIRLFTISKCNYKDNTPWES